MARAAGAQLRALREERERLLEENCRLQRAARRSLDARTKASRQSLQEVQASQLEGAEQRYVLDLAQLERLLAERAEAEGAAARAAAPEAARLAGARRRAAAAKAAFAGLVADVAAASRAGAAAATAAGKGGGRAAVSERVLQYFLSMEPQKAEEVAALRLQAATLAFQAGRAEAQIKEAEELGDSLHLLDFEQLRIENGALAARLEGAGAEVQRLRAKLGESIQIAAHLKQKLCFCERERAAVAARLADCEAACAARRAALGAAKRRRAALAAEREELRQGWSVVTDPRCAADMREQAALAEALGAQADELAARLAALAGGAPA
eukprot:scaffold13.g389.t1